MADSPLARTADSAAKSSDESYVEPSYDIGDVRRALRALKDDLAPTMPHATDDDDSTAFNAAYCTVLTTLQKIAANVARQPVNPQHLTINLRNAAVQKKFAAYPGALQLLHFCGFEERRDAQADTYQLVLPQEMLDTYRVRVERAIAIIKAVTQEYTPPSPLTAEPTVDSTAAAEMTDVVASSAAAPSSVFLANTEEDPNEDSTDNSFESDEAMKPDLAPTYAISEVRAALTTLYNEINANLPLATPAAGASTVTPFDRAMRSLSVREAYCQVLDTLGKITQNVLKEPVNPQHLRVNLANPAVRKKFAQFEGALQYLRFLGFREATPADLAPSKPSDEAAATAAITSPAPTEPSQLLILPEADLTAERVKLTRAQSILTKQRSENLLTPVEQERRELGPVAREMRVFDMTTVANEPSRTLNLQLGAPDEVVDDSKGDMALILAANAAERKRVHDLTRTDVIIMKTKQAELKEAAKRKYTRTLIKITFTDKRSGTGGQQQGSGRFGTGIGGKNYVRGGGYLLGFKIDSPSTDAAPMDVDEGEEKSSAAPTAAAAESTVASAPPSASAVSPAPAALAAANSPAAPPAAEVMVCAYFRPWETLGDLFAFLRSNLLVQGEQTEPFYLHLPPNVKFQCGGEDKQGKHAALLRSSLQTLGLVPAASMYFRYCASSPSADLPNAIVSSLRTDVRSMQTGYDAALLATMMPVAENATQLEEEKKKLLAEVRTRERLAVGGGLSDPTSSPTGGDVDDGDIEAYMRRKKATTSAKPSAAAARPSSSSSSLSSSRDAAANRRIPGFFKPK